VTVSICAGPLLFMALGWKSYDVYLAEMTELFDTIGGTLGTVHSVTTTAKSCRFAELGAAAVLARDRVQPSASRAAFLPRARVVCRGLSLQFRPRVVQPLPKLFEVGPAPTPICLSLPCCGPRLHRACGRHPRLWANAQFEFVSKAVMTGDLVPSPLWPCKP
jgi:hypothetical protein